MATDERYNLVLAFARVLFINGQATEQTVAAAERLGRRLGLRVKLMPRWGELRLQSDEKSIDVVNQLAADPTGVDMDRVVSAMRLIEDVEAGRGCTRSRNGDDRRDLTGAAGSDMAFRPRSCGRRGCSASWPLGATTFQRRMCWFSIVWRCNMRYRSRVLSARSVRRAPIVLIR
jgi:hypothetical protein